MVTETRFGYTRFYNSVGTLLAFQRNVVDELGIPGLKGGDPVSWGIPGIGIANYNGIGDSTDGPFENKNNTLQFLNNTSITRGKHSFRFGGEIRRDQFNQVGNQYGRGSFTFSQRPPRTQATAAQLPAQGDAFASFLLGNVTLTEVAAQIASVQFRATSFALYVDDVWKVTPKLTLSLGLRYENTPPWKDISGNLTTVYFNAFDNTPNVADQSRYPVFLRQGKGSGDPYAGLKVRWPNIPLVQDGRLGDRLVNRDNNDFAPRLGIAWSPNPKWAIRTGAGMFYNQDQGNPRFDVGRNAAGRTRNDDNPDFPAETWLNGASGLAGSVANILTPQAFSNKFDRRTPYTMQWLFNVQRELAHNLTFEAGYLGSISRHLESYRGVSAAVPGPGTVASRSPYPNFGLLVLVENGGRGNYNSLGTKLTKRYSNGMTALVSYTWSKSIDDHQRHPHLRQRHALLAGRPLHALRPRPVGLRQSPSPGSLGSLRSAVRQRPQDGHPQRLPRRSRRRMAARRHLDLARRLPDQSDGRREPRQHQHRERSSRCHRPERVSSIHPTTERWFNTAAFVLQPHLSVRQRRPQLGHRPARLHARISNLQKNFRMSKKVTSCSSAGRPTTC